MFCAPPLDGNRPRRCSAPATRKLHLIRGTDVQNRPMDDGSTRVLTQSWDLHPIEP